MDGGFGVEVHAPENAAEPEKVLIFQPPGAAMLVDLHTQAVAGFTDIGGQVKVRRGEAVLGIPFSMKYRWISCGIVSNFSGSGDILWDLCTFFLKNMVKMLNRPVTYGFADFVHFHVRLHEKLLFLRRFRQKWLFFYFTGILHKGKGFFRLLAGEKRFCMGKRRCRDTKTLSYIFVDHFL